MDYLSWGYSESKIKPFLLMGVQRLEILKNQKSNLVKHRKLEVVGLLTKNQEERARIRAEQIIRDDFTLEDKCPEELLETVSTVLWAASRVNVIEFQEVRKQLARKFGSSFVKAAEENTNRKVNIRVIQKLSVMPPSNLLVHNYLRDIARENNLDWVPTVMHDEDSVAAYAPADAPIGYSVPMAPGSLLQSAYRRL
eukprot:gene36510-47555_t